MKRVIIKDIEIQYNDDQVDKVDYIVNIINKNYTLFLDMIGTVRIISFIPTNDQNVLYIENFDEVFYDGINKIFNNASTQNAYNTPNILSALYIEVLIRKLKINSNMLVQSNSSISDEMLDALISYKYFEKNGTFLQFVEYLKTRNNFGVILNWLKNEVRWDTYNFLLEITVNFLKQNDFNFLENINDITIMMLKQLFNNALTQKSEKQIELPKITIQELDNLFNEFLKYINAPISWKQLYDELKQSNRIVFEKQVDNIDTSACYRDDNDILKIVVSTDGTIKSFCTFVHEFMHYVTMIDSATVSQFSISEFPSIFFEKISAQFLKDKGYKDDVIDEVVRFRNENNKGIYMEISALFNDLSAFIKGGPISKDKKVLFYEEYFKSIKEIRENFIKLMEANGEQVDTSFLEIPKVDISVEVDKECDLLIESFIQNGLLLINGYQYLLDTFLADELLKQTIIDSTIITKMITVTNELNNMNLQKILELFDMQNIFIQNSMLEKQTENPVLSKKITK